MGNQGGLKPSRPSFGINSNRDYSQRLWDWIAAIEKKAFNAPNEALILATKALGLSLDSNDTKRYFLSIQTASNKIKIINGFEPNSANCGNVSVNKLALAPVTATELTITADAFIYLECVAVGDPMTSSTNTIVQYATEQSWETGKEKLLISYVTFSTAITDFSHESISGRVNIIGAC